MNAARPIPKSPRLKPPPLPRACGLSVVPPPGPVQDVTEDLDVTAVEDTPPELLAVARSDVRELRVPRPAPPRPVVKASNPPPLPIPPAAPAVASKPVPAANPEPASDLETLALMKPRPVVFARTVWFFTGLVATGAFRWTFAKLSEAKTWLLVEWGRAAERANASPRR